MSGMAITIRGWLPAYRRNIGRALLTTLVAAVIPACGSNPVTGKSELQLVSQAQEIQIGEQNYGPYQQTQGGDYQAYPEVQRYVSDVGRKLAAVSDRKLPYQFVVINDSTPNAWALPGGKIAVNRGLLVQLDDEAELAAVLGHEIVHAAARHGAKGIERGIFIQSAVIAAGVAAGNSGYGDLVNSGAQLAGGLVNQKYGRDAELESDYYGMTYMSRAGYDPRAAISLQQKFVKLAENQSQDWMSGLFASHPPSRERVDANRASASQLPSGGELGAARYQLAILPLTRSRDAYEAYDEGRAALRKGDSKTALAKAALAISIEPREALFYTLEGDAENAGGRHRAAISSYGQALQRNRDYFKPYLQRGLVYRRLGNDNRARRDLEASAKLLPTAAAMSSLGQLALQRGDLGNARKYLAAAASSDSADGRSAAETLARMDLANYPERFLALRLGLDRSGRLLVQVRNTSPIAVGNIRVRIGYPQGAREIELGVPQTLQPGQATTLTTAIGPLSQAALSQVRVGVSTARPAR